MHYVQHILNKFSFICVHYLDRLGECTVTLKELIDTDTRSFPLNLPGGQRGNIPKDSKITIINVSLYDIPTFQDYIDNGTQINLVIGIDFTESNGDPKLPDSLHYIGNKNKENDYQQAIRSVGTMYVEFFSFY